MKTHKARQVLAHLSIGFIVGYLFLPKIRRFKRFGLLTLGLFSAIFGSFLLGLHAEDIRMGLIEFIGD